MNANISNTTFLKNVTQFERINTSPKHPQSSTLLNKAIYKVSNIIKKTIDITNFDTTLAYIPIIIKIPSKNSKPTIPKASSFDNGWKISK